MFLSYRNYSLSDRLAVLRGLGIEDHDHVERSGSRCFFIPRVRGSGGLGRTVGETGPSTRHLQYVRRGRAPGAGNPVPLLRLRYQGRRGERAAGRRTCHKYVVSKQEVNRGNPDFILLTYTTVFLSMSLSVCLSVSFFLSFSLSLVLSLCYCFLSLFVTLFISLCVCVSL